MIPITELNQSRYFDVFVFCQSRFVYVHYFSFNYYLTDLDQDLGRSILYIKINYFITFNIKTIINEIKSKIDQKCSAQLRKIEFEITSALEFESRWYELGTNVSIVDTSIEN